MKLLIILSGRAGQVFKYIKVLAEQRGNETLGEMQNETR